MSAGNCLLAAQRLAARPPQANRPQPALLLQAPARLPVARWRCQAAAATADAPASAASQARASPEAVGRYLSGLGWGRAWVDGITERVVKRELQVSLDQVQAAVEYLETLGIPTQSVCNMAAICPHLLAADPKAQMQPVVDYAAARGIKGEALVALLVRHPKLLLYKATGDRQPLELGRARASVDVIDQRAAVSYWRDSASFETAPVAPFKPTVL